MRLTFDSVQTYAVKCGYTVEKKSKGYLLNGHVVPTLVKIVEVIKEGDLLDGECEMLPVTESAAIDHKAEVTEIVNRVNDVWDRFSPKDDEIDTVIKIARALHTLNNDCRDNDWHNRPMQPSHPGFWEYAYQCFNKYRVIEECKLLLTSHGIQYHTRYGSSKWVGDIIARKHGQQKRFWWQNAHKTMTNIQYWNTVKELLSA